MPKMPFFSLLAALAVVTSFSVAAMAEDAVETETAITSQSSTHEEHGVKTPDGKVTAIHKDDHTSGAVKLRGPVSTSADADMTVDDEE